MTARPRTPDLGTPAQLEALDELVAAARDAGHTTVCRQNAAWWTQEPPRLARARHGWQEERAKHCRACPVLAQCKALLATGYKVDGVTAGDLYERGRLVEVGQPRSTLSAGAQAANARRATQATAKAVKAHRLHAQGSSPGDIARALDVTTTAVRRYLARPDTGAAS